ncbi:MAG: hypothetical protein Q8T08_04875, partial [Ignavibacteria bacterium]|nr:hypothetical protein [Ignavibacteria bacterium]
MNLKITGFHDKPLFSFYFLPTILVVLIMSSNLSSQNLPDSLRYRANKNYQLQNEMYDAYKTKQADIVMLGNSLTHGANWNELLG